MYHLRYVDFQKFLSLCGVFANIVLVYLVITRAPNRMRPCKFVISIKATIDFLAASLSYYTTERTLSTTETILIISEGSCTRPLRCFAGHMLLVSFLQQNLVWQVIAYIYRYYILRFRNPSAKNIFFVLFASYSASLAHSIIWISSFADTVRDQFPPRIFSKPEDAVMAGWVVYQSTYVILIMLIVSSLLVFGFYLWIRHNLIAFMAENSAKMSRSSMILNRQMLKAAHAQATIPVCFVIGALLFFSMHFGVFNPINVQYLPSMLFILPTIISPVVYFLFLPPYWNFCFGATKNSTGRRIKSKFRMNTVDSTNTISATVNVSVF